VATAVEELAATPEPCEIGLEIRLGAPFGEIIGTQSGDIARDAAGSYESALGNLMAMPCGSGTGASASASPS